MEKFKAFWYYETNPVSFLFWSYRHWLRQMRFDKPELRALEARQAARRAERLAKKNLTSV